MVSICCSNCCDQGSVPGSVFYFPLFWVQSQSGRMQLDFDTCAFKKGQSEIGYNLKPRHRPQTAGHDGKRGAGKEVCVWGLERDLLGWFLEVFVLATTKVIGIIKGYRLVTVRTHGNLFVLLHWKSGCGHHDPIPHSDTLS